MRGGPRLARVRSGGPTQRPSPRPRHARATDSLGVVLSQLRSRLLATTPTARSQSPDYWFLYLLFHLQRSTGSCPGMLPFLLARPRPLSRRPRRALPSSEQHLTTSRGVAGAAAGPKPPREQARLLRQAVNSGCQPQLSLPVRGRPNTHSRRWCRSAGGPVASHAGRRVRGVEPLQRADLSNWPSSRNLEVHEKDCVPLIKAESVRRNAGRGGCARVVRSARVLTRNLYASDVALPSSSLELMPMTTRDGRTPCMTAPICRGQPSLRRSSLAERHLGVDSRGQTHYARRFAMHSKAYFPQVT